MLTIPRGRCIGVPVVEPTDESEHFYVCDECGAWVDMRDLATVLDHEGPLPHPDRVN
jgi:hypothetical protein